MSYVQSAPGELQFTIGRALSTSFGLLGRNFGPMALIGLVVTAVQAIVDVVLSGGFDAESNGNSFLGIVSYALITAPVTYATFQDLRGRQVGAGDMFSNGFKRVGRVIGATFVVGLTLVVPALIIVGIAAYTQTLIIPAAILVFIFVLYIVVIWFTVVPVLVVEDIKFSAGFGRARDLGRGRSWAILGLLLVYGIILFVLGSILLVVAAVFASAPAIAVVLLIPIGAFYSVFGAILPTVVYCLLRAEKEGIGIEDIVKVFD